MKTPAFLKTSLISSLVLICPFILFCISVATSESNILNHREIDNDPMRAGWALLYLSPIIYIILVMSNYIASKALFLLGKFNFKYFGVLAIVFSFLLALLIAHDSFKMFFLTFAIFGLWLSLGAITWHYLGIKSYNKQFKNGRLTAAL